MSKKIREGCGGYSPNDETCLFGRRLTEERTGTCRLAPGTTEHSYKSWPGHLRYLDGVCCLLPFLCCSHRSLHEQRSGKPVSEQPCLVYVFCLNLPSCIVHRPLSGLAFIAYWGIILFGYDTYVPLFTFFTPFPATRILPNFQHRETGLSILKFLSLVTWLHLYS